MATRILVVTARTTGTTAARHSLVDLAGVWISGGDPGATFSEACGAFPGADFSERVSEVTGISQSMATDPYLPPESETVGKFVHWCGAQAEPLILAGLRASMVRAFLLAAVRRTPSGLAPAELPQFHARCLDLQSLFIRHCLASGIPVPSRGFHPSEIFQHFGLPSPSFSAPAIHAALAEADIIQKLL